jgi:hypothetical protein
MVTIEFCNRLDVTIVVIDSNGNIPPGLTIPPDPNCERKGFDLTLSLPNAITIIPSEPREFDCKVEICDDSCQVYHHSTFPLCKCDSIGDGPNVTVGPNQTCG